MHIGTLTIVVHLHAAESLKDKRQILKSVIETTRQKFNISIAEVDDLDDVIDFGVLDELVEEPEPLLGEGERKSLCLLFMRMGDRHDRRRRRRPARRRRDAGGESRGGGGLEQHAHRQVDGLPRAGADLEGAESEWCRRHPVPLVSVRKGRAFFSRKVMIAPANRTIRSFR